MKTPNRKLVIFNPKSGNARAEKNLTKLSAWLESHGADFRIQRTAKPADATRQVREALRGDEYGQIIVAGGDGTFNEAVNGYFEDGRVIRQDVPLGLFNLGTGGDFHRHLRHRNRQYEDELLKNSFKLIDCGEVLMDDDENPRYFVNIASAGISGKALNSLKSSPFQSGSAAFFYHTLKTFLMYKPTTMHIRIRDTKGDVREFHRQIINLFVCNGSRSGGGMRWAPEAEIDSRHLLLVTLSGTKKLPLMSRIPKIYSGRISEIPGYESHSVTEVELTAKHPLSFELDGEMPAGVNTPRLRFKLLPGALPLTL